MSVALSDGVDETPVASSACFQYIPSKTVGDSSQHHSSPQSSFYCIKHASPSASSPLSSTSAVSRPGNARTIFTVIPPIPQDTAANIYVRNQLAYFAFVIISSQWTSIFSIRSECKTRLGRTHEYSNQSFPCEKSEHRCSFEHR